ncbi:hypothetical protein D4R86_05975 [bacterium]|nr:MAG: hypothetical protein D4R86_05975 [bacterium]
MEKKITVEGSMRLTNIIVGKKRPKHKPVNKPFKRIKFEISSQDNVFISFKCGGCSNTFGVTKEFTDMVGEVNFRYSCPYCRSEGSVK